VQVVAVYEVIHLQLFAVVGFIIRRVSPPLTGVGMSTGKVKFGIAVVVITGLACTAPPLVARKKGTPSAGANEQRRAVHALNRLTFGPRPGDVQHVMTIGVDRWIDQQLHPERINDDGVTAHLEPLRTTRMSTKELAQNFPDGQEINQVMNGKKPMPSDAALRMIYEVQIGRQEQRKERQQEKAKEDSSAEQKSGDNANTQPEMMSEGKSSAENANSAMNSTAEGNANTSTPAKPDPEGQEEARLREEHLYADLEVQQLPSLPPDERYKKILSMSPTEQFALADDLRGSKGQEFLQGLAPKQREVLLALNNPGGIVVSELQQAKLLRAIYSERQLQEVMTDFWFNHFNVFAGKGIDRLFITSYERDVVRPHALGKFEELLVATAKSPAMLFYLDNWLSVGPDSPQALGIPAHPNGPYGMRYPMRPRPNQGKRPSGLNENYGRELMELHTLSVNGGYSQRDVTEVAKVLTGWTIEKPFQGGDFKFEPRMHEPGPKFVLGRKIKPNGEAEGLEVLHRLATSPQTAHFISLKLAERFVSDDPPAALVDRMAKTFLKKKGDIREVLSTLFHSPEFWDDSTYRDKVKTPFEFVASAVRATGAEVDDATALTRQLNNMGMPLYGAQPPTGYSMKAENWVSSSSLLNRMNFALALTSGKIRGVNVDVQQLAGGNLPATAADSNLELSALEVSLLAGDISKQTHDSITSQIDSKAANSLEEKQASNTVPRKSPAQSRSPDASMMAGLLLGSPEFQKR
jgi:uncharacterized protein (DUF1800 family)